MSKPPEWMPAEAGRVNGVWRAGTGTDAFAELYARARAREARILPDELVRGLPRSGERTAHAREWRVRAASLRRLIDLLERTGGGLRVLDIGCGNGWMSAAIAEAGHHVVAIDRHASELEQAVRVFSGRDVVWCAGDPWSVPLPEHGFDVVVMAASLQYFADLDALFLRLWELLRPAGAVHVLDTRLYGSRMEADAAAARSARYYQELGTAELAAHYHAHQLSDLLRQGRGTVLSAPRAGGPLRLFRAPRPFHHVVLTRGTPPPA